MLLLLLSQKSCPVKSTYEHTRAFAEIIGRTLGTRHQRKLLWNGMLTNVKWEDLSLFPTDFIVLNAHEVVENLKIHGSKS